MRYIVRPRRLGEGAVKSVEVVLTTLSHTPALISSLIHDTPDASLKKRPPSGKWSIHEHACHLAVVHPMFAQRLEFILREPEPRITPYSPSDEEAAGSLLDMDLHRALEDLTRDRVQLVNRSAALDPDQWHRTVEHPEYTHYSIFVMMRMVALHDLFHGYRINDLLLNTDWSWL